MPALNRRYAAIGWTAVLIMKLVIRRKARAAARAARAAAPEGRHLKRKVFPLLVALAVGATAFFRRRSGGQQAAP
jgi:hypothetical protein